MVDELQIPPTYREIAELITVAIDEGLYPYGSLLPSAQILATRYDVSKTTIHRAMTLLASQGTIVGRQGRGRYVARRSV
jgi:DNA-binding GntR family transcriptional regulator